MVYVQRVGDGGLRTAMWDKCPNVALAINETPQTAVDICQTSPLQREGRRQRRDFCVRGMTRSSPHRMKVEDRIRGSDVDGMADCHGPISGGRYVYA